MTPTAKPRVTSSWHGKLTTAHHKRVYSVSAGAGVLSARLGFRHVAHLRVTVRRVGGDRVLTRYGRSVITAAKTVGPARYRVVVRGKAGATFTLRVARTQR